MNYDDIKNMTVEDVLGMDVTFRHPSTNRIRKAKIHAIGIFLAVINYGDSFTLTRAWSDLTRKEVKAMAKAKPANKGKPVKNTGKPKSGK